MSLLMYGIVERARDGLSGEGLDGRPLRAVADGPLLAVVSDHDGTDPEPTATALTAYERAVRQLMDRGAILPARFGSVLGDEPAVVTLLRSRRHDLLTRLCRVRGAVELALRVSWRDPARPCEGAREPQSGTAYLRDRHEVRQNARRVAGELEPLGAIALSARRRLVPRPDVPVLDAYLVDGGRVDAFVALVERLDGALEDVELVCTGPWPPYSFAEGASV
jgi:Gas vesicle synthesis protein GvpL/GvpF